VRADGSGSHDPDGWLASYAWTFGDGGVAAASQPVHAYAAAGTYTITLTVTDSDGSTATATHPVTVTAPPAPAPPNLGGGFVPPPSPVGPGATPPSLGRLSASPVRFRVRPAACRAAKRSCTGGTKLTFRLATPVRVRFRILRKRRTMGSFTVSGRIGINRITFTGRLGKRALAPGSDTIVADLPAARQVPAGRATVTVLANRRSRR
jgi:PKD repeat protein